MRLSAFVVLVLVGFLISALGSVSASETLPGTAAAVQDLAHRYYSFAWKASPITNTINGLHTQDDQLADFSAAADRRYGVQLQAFRNALAALAPGGSSVHDQVDYLLLRADMEGDWWNRTYLRPNAHNPAVFEEECTNGVFTLLNKPFASNAVRAHDAARRMKQCSRVLAQGEARLTQPVREFGVVASEEIAGADPLFTRSLGVLTPGLSGASDRLSDRQITDRNPAGRSARPRGW